MLFLHSCIKTKMKQTYILLIFTLLSCAVVKPVSNPPILSADTLVIHDLPSEDIELELEVEAIKDDSTTNLWKDYYGAIDGLYGDALKRHLHKLIRNHRVISYQQVWEALETTDECDSLGLNARLLYSGRSQAKSQRDRGTSYNYTANGYALIDSWNREHVWPKSHGFPNERDTAYTDLHHLRPADRSVNSARNTRSFDYADEVYFDNGGSIPTPCKTSRINYTWEPPNAVKGDIARMLFYMVVRYEGPAYDLELVDYVVPNNNKLPILGKLSTLLEWHRIDPVDQRERLRNNLIFELYQGNRNPFIDHPEFVDLIWN